VEKANKYWINARWTLGSRRKFFIVFLLGRDTRDHSSPLEGEIDPNLEQRQPTATPEQVLIYSGIFFWALFSICVVSLTFVYILKSGLGINFFEGSPFPSLLRAIGFCSAVCH
jgi:hypothetical protein